MLSAALAAGGEVGVNALCPPELPPHGNHSLIYEAYRKIFENCPEVFETPHGDGVGGKLKRMRKGETLE